MYSCLRKMIFLFLYVPIISGTANVSYHGEKFPVKYLSSDTTQPLAKDLNFFLSQLKNTLYYCTKTPNSTDDNIALGTYLATAILQRTLLDNTNKLTKLQKKAIVNIIKRGKYYVSHYVYNNKAYGYKYLEYRVAALYQDFDVFVHSLGEFNERRLQKWILSNTSMHSYVENLDDISLKKEDYVSISEKMDVYNISISNSDECISRIIDTPETINYNENQLCRDDYCRHFLLNGPSIAYALSHRVLNLMLRRNIRRCYLQSPEDDALLMDQLCAFMYRESVYLARRGYFARDLFLEHVALCAVYGYKEFFHMHWFYKATSWMDKAGCIQEDRNFVINQTQYYKSLTNDTKKKAYYTKQLKQFLLQTCHYHQMTVLSVVLAHAVRYTAQFMKT